MGFGQKTEIMKQQQSREDLERHFKDALDALRLSSKAFDDGYRGEAKRLAATARVLLHDTGASCSLLEQLGLKRCVEYLSTPSPYGAGNLLTENHLIMMRAASHGGGTSILYVPVLDDFPPIAPWQRLGFDAWWEQGVIRDNQGRTLTRKKMTLALANKDGGAHVDPRLDEIYADLSRNNSLAWYACTPCGSPMPPEDGPELAIMRQIAHELIKTLELLNMHGCA